MGDAGGSSSTQTTPHLASQQEEIQVKAEDWRSFVKLFIRVSFQFLLLLAVVKEKYMGRKSDATPGVHQALNEIQMKALGYVFLMLVGHSVIQ